MRVADKGNVAGNVGIIMMMITNNYAPIKVNPVGGGGGVRARGGDLTNFKIF